ncbi:MAG: outer membrane protein assembly factor BamD [Planctomycetia bacterium]|nr:outer membrane protein assembly factor BamD [Planctomycetia bacterium]
MFSYQSYILKYVLVLSFPWLALLVSGCASLPGKTTETKDLAYLDTVASELEQEPVFQVDEEKIRASAEKLKEEEDSLATLTAEKVGKKISLAFKKLRGLDPNEDAAIIAFNEGIKFFDEGKYDEAVKKFYIADERWPDSALQEDAIFMCAESAFFAKRYSRAQRYYEKLLKKYEASRYLDYVSPRLFLIGRYWDQMDQVHNYRGMKFFNFTDKERPTTDTYGNCLKAYKAIALHDSRGLWADHALMAAANAEYLRGNYESASFTYDQLIKDYPQSKHVLQACELNLSAKLLMYEGPAYDAKCLEDAEEIIERLMTQFTSRLSSQQKDKLRNTQRQIVEAKAERDMYFAKFYEKKRQYKAARFYYQVLIEDYPQTQAAVHAKERYAVIKDYRDEPPDYFAWLKKIFPEK